MGEVVVVVAVAVDGARWKQQRVRKGIAESVGHEGLRRQVEPPQRSLTALAEEG